MQRKQEPAVSQGEVCVLERLAGWRWVAWVRVLIRSRSPWRSEVPLQPPPFSVLGLLVGPQSALPPAWRLLGLQNGADMIRGCGPPSCDGGVTWFVGGGLLPYSHP